MFTPLREVTADGLADVYATNVFGVVRVTYAMFSLLERSDAPVVVDVSSGLGSMAVTTDPDRHVYRPPRDGSVVTVEPGRPGVLATPDAG